MGESSAAGSPVSVAPHRGGAPPTAGLARRACLLTPPLAVPPSPRSSDSSARSCAAAPFRLTRSGEAGGPFSDSDRELERGSARSGLARGAIRMALGGSNMARGGSNMAPGASNMALGRPNMARGRPRMARGAAGMALRAPHMDATPPPTARREAPAPPAAARSRGTPRRGTGFFPTWPASRRPHPSRRKLYRPRPDFPTAVGRSPASAASTTDRKPPTGLRAPLAAAAARPETRGSPDGFGMIQAGETPWGDQAR